MHLQTEESWGYQELGSDKELFLYRLQMKHSSPDTPISDFQPQELCDSTFLTTTKLVVLWYSNSRKLI